TFDDLIARLPYIAGMGFDVLYLPPIHPVGKTHRKGPNNSLKAGPKDPGSPWAIGDKNGGHKAINPELGTIDDFKRLVKAAKGHGLELALDIALQCSPDHPYLREHPEWFAHRPDGSLRYAENPPKKYEDIYPLDFTCRDWKPLWDEVKSIFEFWIVHGVRIFRVDNPHTKPFALWEWLIRELRRENPDLIFLAEAFTRPRIMCRLA
ncbi:MAG: alpha-1,4-glucan--maltose-1-phosphate maltosyltransferase, partial [Elusimicrobia bacterium CG08_land_8_20_14_0_20_59_10]